MSIVAEKLGDLAKRASELASAVETEEATKNALVMPFIPALGYDVFNPREVVPELVADVGLKKGEKVDYAIMDSDTVIMLFECKSAATNLKQAEMSQLFRYFAVTKARIAVLTNGVQYRFYSDLDEPNKMDSRPFLELSLDNLRDSDVAEVSKLAKGAFDIDKVLSAASELKHLREIKSVLSANLEKPSEELVRYFFGCLLPGARFTASHRDKFESLVRKGLASFINDRVDQRLRSALSREDNGSTTPDAAEEAANDGNDADSGIETTEEELEAFNVVKAIAREVVPAHRITHRDTKSYMGILLDDNNRKPICRLHFNRSKRYIGVFDAQKAETRIPIENIDEIFLHAGRLHESIRNLLSQDTGDGQECDGE